MDKAGITLSGNPTFNGPFTVNIYNNSAETGSGDVETDYLSVKKSKAEDFYAHVGEEKFYMIKSHPKGHVLLVNNEFFDEEDVRRGSSKDLSDMNSLWSGIGCDVTTSKDLTAEKLLEAVKRFSCTEGEFDFYVVIIMSHGREDDLVIGTEGGKVEVKEIVKTISNCEKFKGKPKLIFFQMCRGEDVETDAGGLPTEGMSWINHLLESLLDRGRILGSEQTEVDIKAESHIDGTDDVMLTFSTQPNCVSYRNLIEGSWFIQSIKKIFAQNAATHDVRTLMEMVKADVKKRSINKPGSKYHGGFETLDGSDTFRKKVLHLFPGFPPAYKEPRKTSEKATQNETIKE